MDLPDLLSDSVLEWCKDNSEEADHQFNIDCIFLLLLPGLVISKYEPPCPLMRHTPATTNSNRPLATGQETVDTRMSAYPRKHSRTLNTALDCEKNGASIDRVTSETPPPS